MPGEGKSKVEGRRSKVLLDAGTLVMLLLLGWLVWVGQQRTPDRYLQGIKDRGVLRVGIDPTYPPFDTLVDGKVVGYDAELAAAIASDLGVRVEFQTLALDTLYDALEGGKVDMLISALPRIPERQDKVRYSVPYYQAGQVVVTRAGEQVIKSLGDLQGKRVGVERGSNADTEARRLLRTSMPQMQLLSLYHSPEEAIGALNSRGIDAVITDNVSAQAYTRSNPGSVTLVLPPVTDEPYVVAMPAQAEALGERVDSLITRLRSSGELAKIMDTNR